MGHDPMRVGTAARARGLTPNVHVTCVGQDRAGLRKTLEDLQALGIENVFALTGDWPRARPGGPPAESPVFDLDSVHLVRLIDELRRAGRPFHVAVAVSPFKYVEGDCVWQYAEAREEDRRRRRLRDHAGGLGRREVPRSSSATSRSAGSGPRVLGNVYVLGPRAAERMARGEPPGCWVSPALLETVRQEARGKDGGLRARLERAARTVAVLRGLGYAGAYLGGTHDADHIAWIIRRARELAPRWEELAAELRYGYEGGFYLYGPRCPERDPGRGARAPAAPSPSRARSASRSRRTPRRRGGGGSRACSTAWAGSSRSRATPCCGGLWHASRPGPTGGRPSLRPSSASSSP